MPVVDLVVSLFAAFAVVAATDAEGDIFIEGVEERAEDEEEDEE